MSAIVLTLSACQSEPIRVACVGDSITYGHGIKDREHDTYPGLLSAMLGEKYDVRNFGVSGSTTMMGTDMPYMNEQAYKDALAFNPQIVTIKLGTNDSKPYNWSGQDHFKKDLKTLIESFRSLPSKPKIWLCLPVPAYGHAWSINDSVIYNGVIPYIKEVAQASAKTEAAQTTPAPPTQEGNKIPPPAPSRSTTGRLPEQELRRGIRYHLKP